tara:strand:- start:489 stop:1460 length:972 start_codon:yes stop_codon:yes gene_type:complete
MKENFDYEPDFSLYKSEEGYKKMMSWYNRVQDEISVDHESIFADTRFGKTHIILAGKNNQKSILLIPGVAGCAPLWRHQINAFSEHFRVLAIDIVGQPGKSAANPPSVFNDDFTDWLEDIIHSLNLDKPHIIGVSTGGTTAMDMAIRKPDLIDKTVMCGPTGLARARLPFRQWLLTARKKNTDALSDDLTASSFSKPRSGETFGSFDRQLARGMALGTKHYRVDKSLGVYSEKSSRVDFIKALKVIGKFFFSVDKKRLKSFRNKGLLIFGEFEVLYNPWKISKRLEKLIPSLQIEIIKDAGHAAIYDQPEAVNEVVLDFLRKG